MRSRLQDESVSSTRLRSSKEKKAIAGMTVSAALIMLLVLKASLSKIGLITPSWISPFSAIPLSVAFAVYPLWYCYYITTDDGKVYRAFTESMKSAGIIYSSGNRVRIPEIKVKDQKIIVPLKNAVIRKRIESYFEQLSSALPPDFVISELYLSEDESSLICKYVKSGDTSRLYFKEPSEVVGYVATHKYGFPLDEYHSIDLYHTPHLLITGKTGSGKSYYAMLLTMIALLHDWNVYVLDYKQTYTVFDGYCHVAYSVDDIYRDLKSVQRALHERKAMMTSYTAEDPTVTAVDVGFVPIVVVIEEYMALMHSGADKKMLKEIESIIMEITAMGRALSIHLILIMQVSAAKDLDSSIRSNLAPFVFGSANRTIYETAFNTKEVPKVSVKFKPGEGLALDEIDVYRFKAPTVGFPLKELLKDVKRKE